MSLQGYCPLGKGKLLGEKIVMRVAKRCARTPAQVLIRWSIQVLIFFKHYYLNKIFLYFD